MYGSNLLYELSASFFDPCSCARTILIEISFEHSRDLAKIEIQPPRRYSLHQDLNICLEYVVTYVLHRAESLANGTLWVSLISKPFAITSFKALFI